MIANEAIYVVITSWEHWPIFHLDGEDCGKWLHFAQDYFRCGKTLCKGPFVSKRPTTCVGFWWICSSYAHQQGKWRSDDANMDVNMTSQLDNTWTNPPTMCQLPKSSPLLSLLHQSHEWVCFGYMCGEMAFLHFIEYTWWTWSNGLLKASKVEWTWTQNGGVFGVPMLSYPNPYISTTLGSSVVVWVFGWLVHDTQNTNFANLNTRLRNPGIQIGKTLIGIPIWIPILPIWVLRNPTSNVPFQTLP
jgi:hypothetical protein